MAARRSEMKDVVRKMISSGKSNSEIVRLTGVNYKTVVRYRNEMPDDGSEKKKTMCSANFPQGFQREWTLAVNRIRRYCGKELFPMPTDKEAKR